jgi:ATP-dependent DNA helicase PIF1
MSLTKEQEQVMNYVEKGHSMFVSGPGGVGKSYLIKCIYDTFDSVTITALTGCAATLLGDSASTLHSWAGIGLGGDNIDDLVKEIRIRKKADNWRRCQILVIDEVSMLTGVMLDTLNAIAKIIRKNELPFGGIQLLLFGDLYQLPPINKTEGFVFDGQSWKECIEFVFNLKKIIRQTDTDWQRVLNKVRRGHFDKDCEEKILPRVINDLSIFDSWEIKPTILYCRKMDVDTINNQELLRLNKPLKIIRVRTDILPVADKIPKREKDGSDALDKVLPYNTELKLSIGAQVMLLINLDVSRGLINGSRGVIMGFVDSPDGMVPMVKFKNGEILPIEYYTWRHKAYKGVSKKHVPLKLAWACTIHKIQGQTLDSLLVDCGSSVFEYGQTYVALSRVRSLDALYLTGFDPNKIMAHPRVAEFYSQHK